MFFVLLMFLTGVIETAFFWMCRYRDISFLAYLFGVNVVSNCVLNQIAPLIQLQPYLFLVLLLETAVLISEFILLGLWDNKWTGKLFGLLFLSNLISFSIGVVLFW